MSKPGPIAPALIGIGAIAGAAIAAVPVSAPLWLVALGALAGGVAAIGRRSPLAPAADPLERFAPLLLAAFFVPCFTMAVAPGQDMSMYAGLARGLLDGVLSPAWPGIRPMMFHRGLPAVIALASLLAGMARASLVVAGLPYVIFWYGLAAILGGPLQTPRPRLVAALAMFLSRMPQIMFDWGGNPFVLATALGLVAATVLDHALLAAFLLAAAAAIHPMGAIAGAVAVAVVAVSRRAWVPGAIAAAGLVAMLALLAAFGPRYSPGEIRKALDWAAVQEAVPFRRLGAELGDPAAIATAIAAAVLIWRRELRPIRLAAIAILAAGVFFQLMPKLGLYPLRFMPLLVIPAAALWGRAAARWPVALVAAFLVAVPGHLRWFQRAIPMATPGDVDAIACVAAHVGRDDVVDGAYGDGTAWIPALADRKITRPQQHISLFDEIDAALAGQARPSWRFAGQRLRYEAPIGLWYPPLATAPAVGSPLCNSALYRIR
ncbi:MAG: hypothetical protein LC689_21040 [Myxococcales bacterium]|nr:hypothetical protein [Myxococcales bacterium]